MVVENIDAKEFKKELAKAALRYGPEAVENAMVACEVFCEAFGVSYRISIWRHYVLISPYHSIDPVEQALLVYDLESSKLIIDRKNLFIEEDAQGLSVL